MPEKIHVHSVVRKFEWDEIKNSFNIRKHGFDFADAEEIFSGILLVNADVREDYGEDRWTGVGTVRGCAVHVVFTERAPNIIRIISLRKATSRERKQYQKAIQDRLEAY